MASTNRIAPSFVLGSNLDPSERRTDSNPAATGPSSPADLTQSFPYGLAPITSRLRRLGTRTALSLSQSWKKGPPAIIAAPGAADDELGGITSKTTRSLPDSCHATVVKSSS